MVWVPVLVLVTVMCVIRLVFFMLAALIFCQILVLIPVVMWLGLVAS